VRRESINNYSKGEIIFEIRENDQDEKCVRAYAPTQHTILTIATSYLQDFNFVQGAVMYVRVNKTGKCEVTDRTDDETFLMRVVEKTTLNGLDAYTYIVSKTMDQPIINKNIEDQHISQYLNKNRVTVINHS
jgi:hypothetical protein